MNADSAFVSSVATLSLQSTEGEPLVKITAKLWRPDEQPITLSMDQAATTSDGVLVLPVEAPLGVAEEVHRRLERICGDQLTLEMVSDLLDPDELPEVKQFGEGGLLRKVSSFGVRSLSQDMDRNSGLVFDPIEFLAGDGWLICHWQGCKTYRIGLADPDLSDAEPLLRDGIEEEVARRWLTHGGETSGDLGVFFLYELALQYSKARRGLWNSLNAWELDFYSLDLGVDPTDLVLTLRELHRLHGELHRRLAGLNPPYNCAADSGWFANVRQNDTAERVDAMIDGSLANLRIFSGSLRQAVSLTQSYATLRHFALVEEQKVLAEEHKALAEQQKDRAEEQKARDEEQHERLQRGFQLVASILLVPTLIAGIYGANTLLPGGGHWSGFIAMVTLMVLGSGGTYIALSRAGARRSD